ncbi:hypothetical protein [Rhodoluna sp.]|uniref:hypothetical protein n=1 Tax=Rhodoluna sp. TaxID=1969481 RepID=UPI0025D5E2A7|nr:hypothetical protein [Rhodoluna sp.]
MSLSFKLESAGVPDGKTVEFGPFDHETGTQQSIPETLTRRVIYPDLGISALVECVFTGDKLEIQTISVQSIGKFVSTKVLTQLALPAVIRAIAIEVVPNARLWAHLDANEILKREGPTFLAQVYWFEHISWGSPRGSIMAYMKWSRTNANFHISKIARNFPLPGAHSLEKKKSAGQRLRGN